MSNPNHDEKGRFSSGDEVYSSDGGRGRVAGIKDGKVLVKFGWSRNLEAFSQRTKNLTKVDAKTLAKESASQAKVDAARKAQGSLRAQVARADW